MLHQFQHSHPSSGGLRCSHGYRRRCCRRQWEHAIDVSWDPSSRWTRGFLRRRHSTTPTECRHRKKPRAQRELGSQTTSRGQNERFVWLLSTCHLYLAKRVRVGRAWSCVCAVWWLVPQTDRAGCLGVFDLTLGPGTGFGKSGCKSACARNARKVVRNSPVRYEI